MAFEFMWDDSFSENASFAFRAAYTFFKVSDDIITADDVIGQIITYSTSSKDGPWTSEVITDSMIDEVKNAYDAPYKKPLQIDPLGYATFIISGYAGKYLLHGSYQTTYTIPEDGTYIRRATTSEYRYWVQSVASEPSPVPETDYTAMIQGWIVGKRLAAMRGNAEPVDTTSVLGNAVLGMMILGE